MTSISIKAEKRENIGTLSAKKIRKNNLIPAVIYDKNGNLNISIDGKEFEKQYFKGDILSSVIELELGDKKIKTIAHKVELDAVTDRPIHIDFFNSEEKKSVRVQAKINFINADKSAGLKKGGFLNVVIRKVALICDDESKIISKIDVDIATMQVGNKIRAVDLKLPQGVRLLKKDNFLIASITGRSSKVEETATPAVATATTDKKDAAASTAAKDKK
jgi:large subunit ribosomal protein L25